MASNAVRPIDLRLLYVVRVSTKQCNTPGAATSAWALFSGDDYVVIIDGETSVSQS